MGITLKQRNPMMIKQTCHCSVLYIYSTFTSSHMTFHFFFGALGTVGAFAVPALVRVGLGARGIGGGSA